MKNYENNDYLQNKDCEHFVYKDCIITYEDCVKQNPNFTKEEFDALKELYNAMLRAEVNSNKNSMRSKNKLINEKSNNLLETNEPLDILISHSDKIEKNLINDDIIYSLIKLIASGELTDTQIRRSILHFFEKLSYSEISKIEGVGYGRIKKSVEKVKDKLKQIVNKNQK